jgi:protein-disulfide isomerase
MGAELRFVFRNFSGSSSVHPHAQQAAEAAEAAAAQGHFWEMHDQLFLHHDWAQGSRNPRSLFRDFAKAAGADPDKYDACVDGQRYAGRIQASLEEGEALGVGGTPTFFVNGKRFEGHPTSDAFQALVDSLTKSRR